MISRGFAGTAARLFQATILSMRTPILQALAAVVCLTFSQLVPAALVSHTYQGSLTGSFDGYGFPGSYVVGNSFAITVSYDDGAEDGNSDPQIGLFNPMGSMSATVTDSLGAVNSYVSAPGTLSALIFDDYLGINRFDLQSRTKEAFTGYNISLYLSDDANQVISSDLLPDIRLGGAWSQVYFEVSGPQGIGGGGIYGLVSEVPEPSTFALTGVGVFLLVGTRRCLTGKRWQGLLLRAYQRRSVPDSSAACSAGLCLLSHSLIIGSRVGWLRVPEHTTVLCRTGDCL